MMKSDCDNIEQSSAFIKHWMVRQPSVKEESLTDWLLFDVSERIPRITYRAFSRHEEGRQTGADWEWWFLFPRFSYRLRIQAKKVDPADDNYPHIAQTNRYGLQIEKLLHDSEANNSLPLYAFYTAERGQVMCQNGKNSEGVYLAGGAVVYNDFIVSGKSRVSAKDILVRAVPLSCFICCPYCNESEKGFVKFIRSYFRLDAEQGTKRSVAGQQSSDAEPRGYHAEIPAYVRSLLEGRRQPLSYDWEREFRYDIQDIDAILVYDRR